MISNSQKEKIAIQVIRTLYRQFDKFPEDFSGNRNAPFHESFLKAFTAKLENKVESIPTFISLSSWMHGLNTSLGQSFFENTAHILCDGTKKTFKNNTITQKQKETVSDILTELTNGASIPNSVEENNRLKVKNVTLVDAMDFTVDVFFEDDDEVTCVELKTVKPNKGVFKSEKQKLLEARAVLIRLYPAKKITFFIGFPFDPLSRQQCTYDKSRFMDYSVGFRKYFAEDEFLLSSELWDFLSRTTGTMESILQIINSIATTNFVEEYEFLKDGKNAHENAFRYLQTLNRWNLFREIVLIQNIVGIRAKIADSKKLLRIFNQDVFKTTGDYNENRAIQLLHQYQSIKT